MSKSEIRRILALGILVIASQFVAYQTTGADTSKRTESERAILEVWTHVFVEDGRDYDQMIATLRKLMLSGAAGTESLTAQFLIGRVELSHAESELHDLKKAKEVWQPLATKHPKTWQGQMARLGLINISHLEEKHRAAICAAQSALVEIDWELFGKRAPEDLANIKRLMPDSASDLTPDVLMSLIARSYFKLKEPKEAEKWISQIKDAELRRELEEMRGQR